MAQARRALPTWQLFAIAVAIWSTTWHAILYQLEHTTPEAGVALRFGVAGALALGVAAWRGERARFGAREHAWFALQGAFLYGLAYFAVYHAERHVPSGLVAVGYSASPLVNGLCSRLLWRTPLPRRFVAGGLACIAGVALIFWPEFARAARGDAAAAAQGAAFTVAAVLLSAVGSLAASRNEHRALPFWGALGWGMLYGALLAAAVVVVLGQPFAWPTAASWWASLAFLSIAGSLIAFACFLELQQRVGVGAASTVGVMTPVLALGVSALFEGWRPDMPSVLGAALAIAGNALILGRRAPTIPALSRAESP